MIIILYPHISCYNNSHIDTHNYSHTHHTHKTVSHISTKHSGYKKLCAQQLNIKQRVATKCALMYFLQLPQHTATIALSNTNWFVSTLHTELSVKCNANFQSRFFCEGKPTGLRVSGAISVFPYGFTVYTGTTVTKSLPHTVHIFQGFKLFSLPPTEIQNNFTKKKV